MATRGRLFAVCCRSRLSYKDVNTAISTINTEGEVDGGQYYEPRFVVIDSLSRKYTEATTNFPGGSDPFNTPFIDKSAHEIGKMVREMARDTDSDINSTLILILDERTVPTSSALVVQTMDTEDKEAELAVERVRVKLGIVHVTVGGLSVLQPSIDELQDAANDMEDGILDW